MHSWRPLNPADLPAVSSIAAEIHPNFPEDDAVFVDRQAVAPQTCFLLELDGHPAVGPYQSALVADGIPATSFMVDDLDAEYARLAGLGVTFTQPPMEAGPVKMAVLDDTCGNLIQIVQMTGAA